MYSLPPDALTSIAEAAKFLGSNFLTFRASYKHHGVPHTMFGGRPVFFPSELTEWRRKNPTLLPSNKEAA